MATALWGFKTFNRSEVPTLVWVGDDVGEGLKLIPISAEKLGLVRAERQQIYGGLPVPIPEAEAARSARLAKEAADREQAERCKAAESARIANAALEKAKKEAAEAEAALAALALNPNDPELKRKAEKEKAEAEAAAAALKNRRK